MVSWVEGVWMETWARRLVVGLVSTPAGTMPEITWRTNPPLQVKSATCVLPRVRVTRCDGLAPTVPVFIGSASRRTLAVKPGAG